MTPTILVTGANGFVGRHLHVALATRSPAAELIAVDSQGGPGIVGVDLRDRAAVDHLICETRPQVVVHLAAQSSVARTDRSGAETFAVNLGGSLNLAVSIARHVPRSTLLFASSAEVYGASMQDGVVSEQSPLRPINPYARSKMLAEAMFEAVLPKTARLVIVRPFNHTGPGQREDFVLPSFVGQVARIEAGLQAPQLAVGNLDVRRDFIDVRDMVAAYVALLDAADLPARFTCNVGSGGRPYRLSALVEMLREVARVPFDVVVDPRRKRATEVPVAEGDTRLLREWTGWAPRIPISDTLRDMLEVARRAVETRVLVDADLGPR